MKTLYHRLAEQIGGDAGDVLPHLVKEERGRVGDTVDPTAGGPPTHHQTTAQSDRGHENPGPGKKRKF